MENATIFGPGRTRAAVVAITALKTAYETYESGPWDDTAALIRLRDARAERAKYSEYGDSFRSH